MSQKNEPAFPDIRARHIGLTKREYFAAMAMIGLLSDHVRDAGVPSKMAQTAIRAADALIEELEK